MERDSGVGSQGCYRKIMEEPWMGAVLLLACSGHGKTYMGKIYTELNTGMHMPSLTFMYTLMYVRLSHMYAYFHTCMYTPFTYMQAQPLYTCMHNHSPTVQAHIITYIHLTYINEHTPVHICIDTFTCMYIHIHMHTANAYIHP